MRLLAGQRQRLASAFGWYFPDFDFREQFFHISPMAELGAGSQDGRRTHGHPQAAGFF
jgi:hypothetical protein